MKLALVRDSEIYNRKLLGLTLRDRIKVPLERAGFKVRFFNGDTSVERAESYLIINEPVLILERDIELNGRKLLVSDGFTFGYLFEEDFHAFFDGDLQMAIERYLQRNSIEAQQIWAVKLSDENLKLSEKLLLSSLVKAKRTGLKPAYYDGIIARTLNRRISLRISKYLADRNVTPNQITVLSFLISVIGSALFLLNSYLATLIAGIIIQLHSIIDGCDGEIARLKFMESKYGAWLDGVLDRYADFLIIFCITLSLSQTNGLYWVLGFLAAFASFIIAYTGDKYVAVYRQTYNSGSFKIPITRDVRLFLIFLGAVFNALAISVILIAVLGNIEGLRRIIALRSAKL
ncbi:CDP-alcohol phosphatidyltransferase family protein [Archaeoglobus veneficus]|uniref:CDP-alcohol phosphatidyltransferase n=1 Tax=Archaeoglobus veneficus (strain DSM 11195 / SNP6) TaxID=693661 RepID=F2KMH0_ARCVS|nr:CDP-alcohol phosphatidyltransferase family protein [Archaeoglobus veneficus]AEA47167.1 CDP-alcohol phosphatidyltransferase [Archaeoglobus veneficus SNP6]